MKFLCPVPLRRGAFNRIAPVLCLWLLNAASAGAAIIGTNQPAEPLTLERIRKLPEAERSAWEQYFQRSQQQRKFDQETFQAEMKRHGVRKLRVPAGSSSKQWIPVDRPDSYYARPEAEAVAAGIVSFQTPSGGWSKNLNMSAPREPGTLYGPENSSRFTDNADFDVSSSSWSYIGTIDNDATVTQMRYLARVVSARPSESTAEFQKSVLRGLDYLIAAQFPNGGWPQVWPLAGGYHDAITFNDNAFVNVLVLMRDIESGTNGFGFLPTAARERAGQSYRAGLKCLLNTQVVAEGRRTIWPQQADVLTMKPTSARNYEMPSLAASESANILLFLLQLPDPDPEVIRAVHGAAAWFEKTAIRDVAFRGTGAAGRLLIPAPGNGPIWARYYELGTDRPIFGDRDRTIHDSVEGVSRERRAGYSWYGDGGKRALQHYARWSRKFPKAAALEGGNGEASEKPGASAVTNP